MHSPEIGGIRTENIVAVSELVEFRKLCSEVGVAAALHAPKAAGKVLVANEAKVPVCAIESRRALDTHTFGFVTWEM